MGIQQKIALSKEKNIFHLQGFVWGDPTTTYNKQVILVIFLFWIHNAFMHKKTSLNDMNPESKSNEDNTSNADTRGDWIFHQLNQTEMLKYAWFSIGLPFVTCLCLHLINSSPQGWQFVNGEHRDDHICNFIDKFYGNGMNIDFDGIPLCIFYLYVWILGNNIKPSSWISLINILKDKSFLDSLNENNTHLSKQTLLKYVQYTVLLI